MAWKSARVADPMACSEAMATAVSSFSSERWRQFLRCVGGNPLSGLDRPIAMRRADPAVAADEVDRLATAAALITEQYG